VRNYGNTNNLQTGMADARQETSDGLRTGQQKKKRVLFAGQEEERSKSSSPSSFLRLAILTLLVIAPILLLAMSFLAIYHSTTRQSNMVYFKNTKSKYTRVMKKSGDPSSIPILKRGMREKVDLPVPGLRVPHARTFAAVPPEAQNVVCWQDKARHMARAFESRNWTVTEMGQPQPSVPVIQAHEPLTRTKSRKIRTREDVKNCVQQGVGHIIWTRGFYKVAVGATGQPWQRYSWLHSQHFIDNKSSFHQYLTDYAAWSGESIDFVPQTFVLPKDQELLLQQFQSPNHNGMERTWVLKLPASNRGTGIAIVGGNSPELHALINYLEPKPPTSPLSNPAMLMSHIRDELVLFQKEDDVRDIKDIESARRSSNQKKNTILVQEYVCHELPYQGHKFHVRIYFLIASIDPLLVLYHDGFLRVAHEEYNEGDRTVLAEQITNLEQGNRTAVMATFEEWEHDLHEYLGKNDNLRQLLPENVVKDPLTHLRNQMKAAVAKVVDATRHVAYKGYRSNEKYARPKDARIPMENAFALMGGDFIVDRNLNVHMTEAQSSPALYDDQLPVRRASNELILPCQVDILEDITRKQVLGQPLLPINKSVMGKFEIVFTDDFRFQYNAPRSSFQTLSSPC
jgi:hypothetical protein